MAPFFLGVYYRAYLSSIRMYVYPACTQYGPCPRSKSAKSAVRLALENAIGAANLRLWFDITVLCV